MSSRRQFVKNTAVAALAALAPLPSAHADDGKKKSKSPVSGLRIQSVIRREETVLRYPVHGDNWHMTWASDDRQYVGLCDGAGFTDQPKKIYNSRMLAISGGARDATFYDLPGYPMRGAPTHSLKDPSYYNFGTLALDSHLYQFMSTLNRPARLDELEHPSANDLLRFNGAKLIYSPDNGRTWHNQDGSTPVVWEPWDRRSRETLLFFEEDQDAFSLLTVLQMGRNYHHNRDGYLYVYAPNGNTEGTMNELVMFRVPKGKLLDRASYEYFAGWSASSRVRWSRDIKARAVVHTFPRGWVNTLTHPYAWHPSIVYNAPLGVYLMANWGMGTAPDGLWFDKPSYLGFWIAQNPWGPWTQVHEETAWLPAGDKNARAYQPQISPKWIAADGKSFWLVWTDFQKKDEEAFDRFFNEEMNARYRENRMTDDDRVRMVAMLRKFMPYYAFNVQRVDLVV